MSARRVEAALWGVAALALLGAVAGAFRATPAIDRTAPPDPAAAAARPPRRPDARAIAAAAAAIIASDPFRLERRPAQVAFGAEPPPAVEAPTPPPPARPALVLSGIIGGPPWEAILEGVPGRRGGVLVRAGQALGELRVRAVRPDTVVVEGPDTTWILTLRRPWP